MSKDFKNFAKAKATEANDIDSLVEEELSRGRSEDCSIEDEGEEGRAVGADAKTRSKHGSPRAGSGAKTNGRSSQGTTRGPPNGSSYQGVPMKMGLFGAAQQRRSSLEHENDDAHAEDALVSSNGKESQMFKDLFQVTNKSKGIAGIGDVKGMLGEEAATWADLDPSLRAGPKLVSAKKTEELQMMAQMNAAAGERQMIKNRSKKDLKNKFKSSSALYSEGAKAGEPEDEDDMKGDAEAKNISEIIQRHI